jgi:hypothetical protein
MRNVRGDMLIGGRRVGIVGEMILIRGYDSESNGKIMQSDGCIMQRIGEEIFTDGVVMIYGRSTSLVSGCKVLSCNRVDAGNWLVGRVICCRRGEYSAASRRRSLKPRR